MQENRSFDHCYGTLRGVRGFNDPRAVTLPDGNPVWLQTERRGRNLRAVPAEHQGHQGHLDGLAAARLGRPDATRATTAGTTAGWTSKPPATRRTRSCRSRSATTIARTFRSTTRWPMRSPICDQNFCSSLTGTTPNRLYLGPARFGESPTPQREGRACGTSDADLRHGRCRWKTFPERLEDARRLVEDLPERTERRDRA